VYQNKEKGEARAMNKGLKHLCLFVGLFQGIVLYAQNTQPLPDSFYVLRDAVYMQNTSTPQIVRLYATAKTEIEQTLTGVDVYIALSRCAYLAGITFQAEGRKSEAAAYYDYGIARAEDSLSITPTSEGYQYLAANIALSCSVRPLAYVFANVGKIEEYAQRALALNPRNWAAQFIIATKYIQAPWPIGNMKKGANLLREIISRNIESLESEDLCNIYLAMAVVSQKEKRNDEDGTWQGRALVLYPTNRFRETLLRHEGKWTIRQRGKSSWENIFY
jgi:tetratricopeptide (TPR) repeat protein